MLDMNHAREYANQFVFKENIEDAMEAINECGDLGWEKQMEADMVLACLESSLAAAPEFDTVCESYGYEWACDVAMEGLVNDARKKKSATMSQIRVMKKEARKLARKKDYAGACAKLEECIRLLGQLKKELKEEPDSVNSFMLSQIMGLLVNLVMTFILAAASNLIGNGTVSDLIKSAVGSSEEYDDYIEETVDLDYLRNMKSGASYKNGVSTGAGNTATATLLIGALASVAKFGLQSVKVYLQAKKANKAASDTDLVRVLNDNNRFFNLILADIDRVIQGLRIKIKQWKEKGTKDAAKMAKKDPMPEA